MALTVGPVFSAEFKAVDFKLLGIDNKEYVLADFMNGKPFVVIFMCNHCPYVKGIISKLSVVSKLLVDKVNFVAINSNDPSLYPEDSFENMKKYAEDYFISFPYLVDVTQDIARAYDARCTPDFFGFDAKGNLKYRGRFDNKSSPAENPLDTELAKAMLEVVKKSSCTIKQYPSIGCSIKWKESNKNAKTQNA